MSSSKKQPGLARGEDPQQPIQAHLGDQLKKYFSSIVSEPVPDRFSSLLDELEKQERAGQKDGPEARK
ncbi:MAG: NepR family anti-sigma factor [Rhodoblastus sp.]